LRFRAGISRKSGLYIAILDYRGAYVGFFKEHGDISVSMQDECVEEKYLI